MRTQQANGGCARKPEAVALAGEFSGPAGAALVSMQYNSAASVRCIYIILYRCACVMGLEEFFIFSHTQTHTDTHTNTIAKHTHTHGAALVSRQYDGAASVRYICIQKYIQMGDSVKEFFIFTHTHTHTHTHAHARREF